MDILSNSLLGGRLNAGSTSSSGRQTVGAKVMLVERNAGERYGQDHFEDPSMW